MVDRVAVSLVCAAAARIIDEPATWLAAFATDFSVKTAAGDARNHVTVVRGGALHAILPSSSREFTNHGT